MSIYNNFRFISYLISLLLFIACGNDDNDSKNEQLQGSWVIQNKTITVWPRPRGRRSSPTRFTDRLHFFQGRLRRHFSRRQCTPDH